MLLTPDNDDYQVVEISRSIELLSGGLFELLFTEKNVDYAVVYNLLFFNDVVI